VAAVADFHRVKTPTPLEFPPPTTRPATQPTSWDWLVLYVTRPLWGFRVELAAFLALLPTWRWLAGLLGSGLAAGLLAAAIGGLLAVPAVRRRLLEVEHRARLRRRWATACRYTGLANASDRVPRIVRHALIPAGDRLLVRLPAGSSTAALAEAAEQVAVILDVRQVRVARDSDRAALARVTVVRRDPLHGAPPLAWPWLDVPRCSLWVPVPVGIDEDGQWVHIALPERNVLLGGEPGSGKSGAMALLLAAAALDPSVKLILLDGKLVELACWAGVADRSVGPDLNEAIDVLAEVQAELDRRLLTLLANRRRKLTPGLGLPLLLVVVDELAFYVNAPDRKLAAEFAGRLRDLVARGRAAGIVVLAATQKPAAEVIPTSLRDLFGFRWALRCLTPQASDTVLGQGWASLGYTTSTVDAADRGVGLLLAEGGTPVRLRACWLDDDQLHALAGRAEALRGLALPPPPGARPGPAGSGQPGG
jgi:FtsK/SpoIIIE family